MGAQITYYPTAAKRTKEQRSEVAKKAAKTRREKVKREREPNVLVFERVLQSGWFVVYNDKKHREYYYSQHRIPPLLDAGYVEFDRKVELKEENPCYYYRPTPEGIKWWVTERAKPYADYFGKEEPVPELASVVSEVEGKGMGTPITFFVGCNFGKTLFLGIRDGFFDFVRHSDYCGMAHGPDEYLTVALTRKGYEYFSALPRFVEVWE